MLPPDLRDRYQILKVLGRGGMGKVVSARDLQLDRTVAIKVILQTHADPDLRTRFRREGQLLARIDHPNVLKVFDLGEAEGQPFLVTELLEGRGLDQLDPTPPAGKTFLDMALDVAAALDAVHTQGLVHRDVKPGNLFLTNEGRVVLLDFGLILDPAQTRLTASGAFVGTPYFLAPEVIRGAPFGPSSDWYGLGATLFWMHERRPYQQLDQLHAFFAGGPAPAAEFRVIPDDSSEARFIRACTDPDPDRRPADLEDLRARLSLSGGAAHRPASTRRLDAVSPPPSAPAGTRRRAVAVALALVAGGAAGWFLDPRPPPTATPPPPPTAPSTTPWTALAAELDAQPAPDLPIDPLRLLDLPTQRPALVTALTLDLPPGDPQAADLARRLQRLGLPAPLDPTPPGPPASGRGNFLRALAALPALEPVIQDLVHLDQRLSARKRLLREADPDLPISAWGTYARIGDLETLVDAAFHRPAQRSAVATWLSAEARVLRRMLRNAARALREGRAPPQDDEHVRAVLRGAVERVRLFFYTPVSFLPPEVLLGPPATDPAGRAFQGHVLRSVRRVRLAASAADDDLRSWEARPGGTAATPGAPPPGS